MPETRYILQKLHTHFDGEYRGKHVLEIGCGCGEASVFFAKKGMRVIATDVSPGMLQLAEKVATLHGVRVDTVACPAEKLPFEDETFDVVYAANVIHHVDIPAALSEIYRVLRQGGIFVAWDPVKYNPAINLYRKRTPDVRTPDEHPVDRKYLSYIRSIFVNSKVSTKGFWLTTLYIFVKYYFVDKVDPNKERYWKKVVADNKQLTPLYRPLEKIDKVLLKCFPFLKWWCWNMVVIVTK